MTIEINSFHMLVGRLNPMTIYHRDLIEQNRIRYIFLTGTEDAESNPIPARLKVDMTLEAFRHVNYTVVQCSGVFDAIQKARAFWAPEHITLHCGSDRAADYQRLNTYSKELGLKELVVQSYDRLDDQHSATHLRQLAKDGNFKEFEQLCGYRPHHIEVAYEVIRHKYGCI